METFLVAALYNVLLEDGYAGPVQTVALLLRREAGATGSTGPSCDTT